MPTTMKTMLLVASLVAASVVSAAAQDQESGDVVLDTPAAAGDTPLAESAEVEVEADGDVDVDDAPSVTRSRRLGKPGPLRVYGGISVAVGGSREYSTTIVNELTLKSKYDLDPMVGFQGGADYVVMDYFAIGGEMRFLWTKIDGFGDRDFLWDLVVRPRGRYVFDKLPLEVYGVVPVGLTIAGIKGRPEGSPGFNLGVLGGASWFLSDRMAVNAEMGWVFHKYGIDVGGAEGDIKQNQFLLLCPNFVYVL